MWNMMWWIKGLVVMLALQTITVLKIYGQKNWDGGGNDSLWNNPLNWHPDGIPTANDTVVFNNQWIRSSYHVYFPEGMVTSHAYSITIDPATGNQISVTLPSNNVGSPGLILYTGDTALVINNGSIFYNSSGANAGNSIQITGKLMIKNGGKYVHQTLRGNALLIANLVVSPDSQKGIFELNVPGNSAYTLSASGRTFGSLMLNGQNSTKKTYTSSGNNQLAIKGDLIITDQATYTSSLTNNILISGDMIIKGRLHINPISGDTIGRCLETNGSNNKIEISGQLNQGVHFRKWIVSGKYQLQNSIINIDHIVGQIHIQSNSTIDLGNSIIKGVGEFKADSNCSFLSYAKSIIGSDTAANIQTVKLNLHNRIKFTCYGSSTQTTGDRFPEIIGKLKIEKSQNNLFLSKSISILDSLLLLNGKLICNDTASVSIMQYCDAGNEKSFFTGKLIHLSKNPLLFFPLGKDNLFAPIQILRHSEIGHTYEVVVDSLSPTLLSYPTVQPIQQLSNSIFWKIKIHQLKHVKEQAQIIYRKQIQSQFDCIVVLDSLSNTWKLSSSRNSNDSLLIAPVDTFEIQQFTLGKLSQNVLPLSSIYLKKKRAGEEIILTWVVDDDENVNSYVIESSSNGLHYETIDTTTSIQHKGPFSYSKKIKKFNSRNCFYRIKGIDIDGRFITSNIVTEQNYQTKIQLYPNPSRDILYLKSNEPIKRIRLIYPHGDTKSILYKLEGNMAIIPINALKAGNYFLVIELSSSRSTIPFVKQ